MKIRFHYLFLDIFSGGDSSLTFYPECHFLLLLASTLRRCKNRRPYCEKVMLAIRAVATFWEECEVCEIPSTLELCAKGPTRSHKRCRQDLGSAGCRHSHFWLLDSTYSQPRRSATDRVHKEHVQRGSTIDSDQCQQFVWQCTGIVHGKGCTPPSCCNAACSALPQAYAAALEVPADNCWLCKLTQQPGVSRKVKVHIKQWFEVVGSIMTRWWLCSAADRNHIPTQPSLGQVESATQTAFPIREGEWTREYYSRLCKKKY